LPGHRGEHPGPRGHRLHLGAPGAPVLPACHHLADVAGRPGRPLRAAAESARVLRMTNRAFADWVSMVGAAQATAAPAVVTAASTWSGRSEERRVGKECRSRW